jgi:hypothetical protein
MINVLACNSNKEIKTTETIIYGFVDNAKGDSLRLIQFIDMQNDIWNNGEIIRTNKQGYFSFKISNSSAEMYHLIYESELKKGQWRPIKFFNDADSIEFKLNSTKEISVHGGTLNDEFTTYQSDAENYFMPKFKKADTKEAQEEISKEYGAYRYDYIHKNKTAFSYYMLLDDILYNSNNPGLDKKRVKNYAKVYQEKFPNHAYSKIIDFKILALEKLGKGDLYIPFSATNSNNEERAISDIIAKNKITIIDLWAPW